MSSARLFVRAFLLLRSRTRTVAAVLAANLLLALAQFAEPVLFGRIIDALTRGAGGVPSWSAVLPLLAGWGGFGIFSVAAAALIALGADRLAHRERVGVTAVFFEHVLHLPASFHADVHSGRLAKVMHEGGNALAALWLPLLREQFATLAGLGLMAPLALWLNWRLGILLIVMVAAFGLAIAFVLRRTAALQQAVEGRYSELSERASDALGNLPVIQSFTLQPAELSGMRSVMDRLLAAQMPVLSWWAAMTVATRAGATATVVAIVVMGVFLNLEGLASVGEIVTFIGFATALIGRLERLVAFLNSAYQLAPKLDDFFRVLDTSSSVVERPDAADVGRLAGRVAFEDVAFSYDGRRDAVAGLSFTAEPGETIALVGATGSGKTTTLGLLHRVVDPTRGRVTIDGIDVRAMTLASLRRNIGVVFQEPMLFARSIEDNLRIGKPDATAAELDAALAHAQAREFVRRQPQGLATPVGERGRALSGGERQRLSIARALLKDPPVMVLDEATSALDAATEAQLQAALAAATRGRTTLVIAHRLATVRHATRILVLHEGRLVESGSFADLVARGGHFAQLARAQFMADAATPSAAGDAAAHAETA